ncbi:hypothetical protein M9H77_04239 [Catharanthus roseus]|uniref:Uncharacterized protein n=1 Tax=Catharanthus roseus TaxID=4058 RepID=A0ACC0CDL3_CATRO|nr:hypothetical protein M9H77_04239 [Catharanthus roseus]
MAKSWKRAALLLAVALGLQSPVGFCWHNSKGMSTTADSRFHSTVAGRSEKGISLCAVLMHLFQHERCIPSCATNATSLERFGTTIFMPSKGCEGPKKRRRS